MPTYDVIKHHRPRSAYIHVPFCLKRCGYCDFSIIAGRDDLVPRFLKAIDLDISRSLEHFNLPPQLETLFIGGGTPTMLQPADLEKLLTILLRYFRLEDRAEVTIEANPDGLSIEKQRILCQMGVNRVSLGVQSFDPEILERLGRQHTPQQVVDVVEHLSTLIPNVSLDLIYGVPGQSIDCWKKTIRQAISLQPTHLSTYALTFEKGTSFWSQRSKGELRQVGETMEIEMYQWTVKTLEEAGYQQYEISNFAKSGMESRHNCVYWVGEPYWAFGPGASRFIDGIRTTNHRSPFTWLKRIESGLQPDDYSDDLTSEERARELFAIGLRYLPGVEKSRIRKQTGHCIESLLQSELSALMKKGWIEETEQAFRLTPQGRLFADEVACEVI